MLALFEANQLLKSFITYGLNLKNYELINKISIIILPLILDIEYTEIFETQPDFHSSFEFAIFLHLNIYYTWITSNIAVNYYTKALSRITNKQMQEIWLENTICFHKDLFSLQNSDYFNQLQYGFLKGMNLGIKGRAANLKKVELREFTTSGITKSKFNADNNFYTCYSMNYFTTKWGSTSCRISFAYKISNNKINSYTS